MQNTVYHPADSRGMVQRDWLLARHTFSFGSYQNPDRMHFGVLRVLNDDVVAPGGGFATHAHDNMEIITIPLRGSLAHKDSLGHEEILRSGEIQVMSAGTGIEHSEYNPSETEEVNLLQIWMYPNRPQVLPRYQSLPVYYSDDDIFQQILSPYPEDAGGWAYQNAWFFLATLHAGARVQYDLKVPANGVYLFVVSGTVVLNNQMLHARDGYGIWSVEQIPILCTADALILLMEVPMGFM